MSKNNINYAYDRDKNILIRHRVGSNGFIHEVRSYYDKKWIIVPNKENKYEEYARAIFLGQGAWDRMESITNEEAYRIMRMWGIK